MLDIAVSRRIIPTPVAQPAIARVTRPSWLNWLRETEDRDVPPVIEREELIVVNAIGAFDDKDLSLADEDGNLRVVVSSISRLRESVASARFYGVADCYVISNVIFGADRTNVLIGEMYVLLDKRGTHRITMQPYGNLCGIGLYSSPEIDLEIV